MTEHNRQLALHRALRSAPWLVSLATFTTGLILLLNRTVVAWDEVPYEANTWEATPIDVTGIGLALLCTGILSLVLTLLAEGARPRLTPRADPTVSPGQDRGSEPASRG